MRTMIQKHYHWVIAVIVFFEMIVFGGMVNSIGIYTIPITQGLGVDRGPFTIAGMPYGLLSLASTLFTGFLLRKFGYKKVAIGSLLLTSSGFFVMAFAPGLLGHGIGRGLLGLGYGACFTAGAVWIIKQWFHAHQGLVIGVISMASGLGGSVMSFAFSRVIVVFNWRVALMIEGLLPILVAFLYFLMYDAPEKKSLRPYGVGQTTKKAIREENNWPGLSLKEQYRHPLLYTMCIATLVSSICVYTTSSVMNPHFQDNGYTATAAASYDSVLMLTLAFVKLLLGWISDKFGAKPVAILCLVCAAAGQWILSNVASPTLSYIGVALFSVGLCLSTIVIPLVALPLFGYKGSAEINGIIVGMSALASLVTAPVCNFVYDRIHSYSPAFRVAAVMDICLIGVYLVMFTMAKKVRKREMSKQKI